MTLVPKVEKSGQSWGGGKHHVAAVSPVAAVRPSARHEHLATKAAATIATATGFYSNGDFVDKHRIHLIESRG
jgi:hypothetical protein